MAEDPAYREHRLKGMLRCNKISSKRKYHSDPQFKAKMKLYSKFHHMFGELVKMKRNEVRPLIGCTLLEFGAHLESQFQPGMTWENYGRVWQIDHIDGVTMFNLTSPEGVAACWHYTNLRPMFKLENTRKKNHLLLRPEPDRPVLSVVKSAAA